MKSPLHDLNRTSTLWQELPEFVEARARLVCIELHELFTATKCGAILSSIGVICIYMGMLFLVAAVCAHVWDSPNRVGILYSVSAACVALGAYLFWRVQKWLHSIQNAFQYTKAEFKKDWQHIFDLEPESQHAVNDPVATSASTQSPTAQ